MIETKELRLGKIILFNDEPLKVMCLHSGKVLFDCYSGVVQHQYRTRSSTYSIMSDEEGF